jgi:hypothetical protein
MQEQKNSRNKYTPVAAASLNYFYSVATTTDQSATVKCARRFSHQQFSLLSKQKGFSSP